MKVSYSIITTLVGYTLVYGADGINYESISPATDEQDNKAWAEYIYLMTRLRGAREIESN
ncbi:hypothetical protein CH63R_12058 [Colletotrichum higginsianum IMI 349063]|uniref:Uncharacterized protein n=1 Tax=Colletotrichum higginsianum (strain IMI 349063) TaxID=759273 RepID=A0A1B7Y006_COLHI|nr:hypothetical protein CH63R_12058 [Colletotrichum higginsianum IMI 349063]OBR05355.1 hypothetical protein CH63R_12058 [Colletotrichum higginsianum IMI 349063]GJC99996.1 hypothetical protein ColKHC_08822 [Colletotrichum higginsianum]